MVRLVCPLARGLLQDRQGEVTDSLHSAPGTGPDAGRAHIVMWRLLQLSVTRLAEFRRVRAPELCLDGLSYSRRTVALPR